MDSNNGNQNPNDRNGSNEKITKQRLLAYLNSLAVSLGQTIGADRAFTYVQALEDLGEAQVGYAFKKALLDFKPDFGKAFPYPAEIREWAFTWNPTVALESQAILERDDKPTDWQALGRSSGTSSEDVQRWLEEGRARQQARIAEMKADPKWRAMYARLNAPRRPVVEPTMSPVDRRRVAQEMGWLPVESGSREPGDEP